MNGFAAAPKPEKSLARLDEDFGERTAAIARRADAAGAGDLAALVRGWPLPMVDDRQVVLAIPARLEKPAGIDATMEPLWEEVVAARRERAAGTFAHAQAAANRPCTAVELLSRTLRDDPEHARARAAAGYVRHGERWVRPEAARRLGRGEEFDPAFGWQPKGRLARLSAGERLDRGRWITRAADEARRPAVADGRRFTSDHWEILSAAPLADAAALAAGLEETAEAWRQVFGAVAVRPADWERQLAGRGKATAREPFAAVLCGDRPQYVAELGKVEPTIARTTAIYWRPTQTAWFCTAADRADDAPAGIPLATVRHEATHQLCAEAHDTSPLAGERCGFWAIEAAACHMESLVRTEFGWTAGGPDAGGVPAARKLLVEEEFHVPLEELCRLGRVDFQADDRLPRIYDELGGLAEFLMNGRRGRHREAFVAYLARVYAGTADPDTLARLCDTSFADLDAEYRRHLSR
ncbi:MAG: hypothetical protein ACKOSQ_08665 [Planctomycetaceae bacterium]